MSGAPDVSVVLVSFNTAAELQRTLQAVLSGAGTLAIEVVVVDNASADGSAALVAERFPQVRLLVNDVNRYYSAANNQGLAVSRGRYLLVLNPDAEPDAGTLPAMAARMEAEPGIGALTARLYFPDGTLQRNCARQTTFGLLLLEYTVVGLLRPRARRRARAWHRYGDWDRTSSRDVEVVPGSCLMVRRDVFERVGGFDERLRMYFGEDEWCRRIRQAGYRVAYAAVGRVVHPEGASAKKVARHARDLYFADLVRFTYDRWGAAPAALLWVLTRPTRWALHLAGWWRG